MKNFRILALTLLGLFSLNSCGDENKKEQEPVPMQNDTRMDSEHAEHGDEMGAANLDDGALKTQVEFSDEAVASVYQHYMHIKTALVNTNSEEAGKGGEMMLQALEKSEAGEQAVNSARVIAENEDINEQRAAFLDLSASIENMLEGALTSGEIYKQYCPMAFGGSGGSWLSGSEEIRNPYYGDKMLKCGRVEQTIQ